MKVYTEEKIGSDGNLYSIRYLLDDEEFDSFKRVGLVGESTDVVIGIFEVDLEHMEFLK